VKEQTRYVQAGTQKTRLLETGSGAPVIVLHGWGGRIESMTPAIACLAGAFRVLAFDLPGFGESPTPSGGWGTPDYAAFVRDLIAAEGIQKAHFVGHSFGAKTSLLLAATHPEMVGKLVAVASSGLKTPPSVRARAKRLASRSARAVGRLGAPGSALRDAVYDRIASSDYREAGPLRPILVRVVNEDLSDHLRRVTAPTLLVWGDHDDSVPLSQAKRMERLIPDAGLVVFEGAGHFAYLDEPQRFCHVVRHFLGAPPV
jgi:pimeloyl-ACP methyl ester carboxylesterase